MEIDEWVINDRIFNVKNKATDSIVRNYIVEIASIVKILLFN